MSAEAETLNLFAPEQFRMSRLQVYNWGTFSGLHNIPISEQGFLFVGRSGSGKSTLLDAFSALLVPPRWVDFNAAARETEKTGRDRNLASYIRGAWAEQKDDASGEIATRYLRTGTTWSALALTYRNSLDQHVVLVQVLWLRGSANGPGDVNRHFMISERPFELGEVCSSISRCLTREAAVWAPMRFSTADSTGARPYLECASANSRLMAASSACVSVTCARSALRSWGARQHRGDLAGSREAPRGLSRVDFRSAPRSRVQ